MKTDCRRRSHPHPQSDLVAHAQAVAGHMQAILATNLTSYFVSVGCFLADIIGMAHDLLKDTAAFHAHLDGNASNHLSRHSGGSAVLGYLVACEILHQRSTMFEKDGIKYGFCAFAPNRGTVSINEISNAVNIVANLDSLCDIVIVSFHGGAEGSKHTHITRSNEIYLGENRGNPYKFARDVIDAGADIVFGHGPHVTRAIDLYKDRFIAYNMRN